MLKEFINNKKCLPLLIIILTHVFITIFEIKYKNKEFKNYINVAYAFDKNYHYITHVSMKSIMINQNDDTFINFYILVSNLTIEQKEVINKIKEEHKNCKINFIDMGEQFKEFSLPFNIWSTANYYRIKLPELLPEIKKIIYLDTDTLIYKDLTKFYNYPIEGKYLVGMPEYVSEDFFIRNNVSFNNFINTGALLCNLDELRKDNISYKIFDYIKKNHKKILFPVNEPTNLITHKKNGYFTPEYVVVGYCNENEIYRYYNTSKLNINKSLVKKSYKDPYVYHFIMHIKPWMGIPNINGTVCFEPISRFYEAVRKTSYYYEILELFPVFIKNIIKEINY